MSTKGLDKNLVHNLTWNEFAQRVDENYIFIIPTGSIEEHGPHMPLGMDNMSAYEISMGLTTRYHAVVMPPLTYGYRSQATIGGGDFFPGTTSVGAEAYIYTARDILLDLLRHDVRRIVFVNGHLENMFFLTEAIELARRNHLLEEAKILLTSWDLFIKESTLDIVHDGKFPGWALEHAAVNETSLMLSLRPEVVDMDKLPDEPASRVLDYSVFPPAPDSVTKNGALCPATGASVEKGNLLLDDIWAGYERTFSIEFGLEPRT